MKIELKSIKYSAFMSEETNAFEATVYIDGTKAGRASNRGHGDPINIYPYDLQVRLDQYGSTLPMTHYHGLDLKQDAESLINDLLSDWLIAQDLKKLLSSRIIFAKGNEIRQTKVLAKDRIAQLIKSPDALAPFQADKILNVLPFAEALTIYKELAA